MEGLFLGRYYFTNYKNKKILVLDFSSLSEKAILKLINESKLFISKQPENSIISLVNMSNLTYNTNILNAFQEYVKFNEKYVLASAIYGLSTLQMIAIQTLPKFTSMILKVYKTELAAKNWLVTL